MKKPRNILSGRCYDLGASASKRIAPPWVHAGVLGGGLALGYISYPYAQTPMGMTLMGAAGSVVAAGLLLLVYDLARDENLITVANGT